MNRMVNSRVLGLMATLILGLGAANDTHAGVVDFEDLTPNTSYTGPGGGKYWNGSDGKGGFVTNGATFANSYDNTYGSWSGWSYSNTSDTVTDGYTNQFSAYTGIDHTADPGKNYAVYSEPWSPAPTLTLAPHMVVQGAWITNTTYAALSMKNGDGFAKKFGGATGNEADWFLLSISGTNSLGQSNTVDFYLADYRFGDNASDYIVNTWSWVDLTALGDAQELTFDLSSSDVGQWGMNTPALFALDDLVFSEAPEPTTLVTVGIGLLLGTAVFRRRNRIARAS
jgi:hypothetical protein